MPAAGNKLGWYKLLASRLVTRYWPLVILAWISLAILLRSLAPAWDSIAADGDLAFLPDSVPSSIGQRALENAFPGSGTRSQIVIVAANESAPLANGDIALVLDLARRLHWLAAESAWRELRSSHSEQEERLTPILQAAPVAASEQGATSAIAPVAPEQARIADSVLAEIVRDNLTEAIEIENSLSKYFAERESGNFRRLPDAYRIRGELLSMLGDVDAAAADIDTAKLMREQATPTLDNALPDWFSAVRDVWSWRNSVVGHKLQSGDGHAKLIAIQLGTEFTAVSNIELLNGMEKLISDLRLEYGDILSDGFRVEASGSAAVGADMLRAAASGVQQTEIVTVLLVLLILALVYRAPFLVAIPLTSIALSLIVATSVIALLARDPANSASHGLGVFTTTRIFIVVLLFGAGTDFCLFLLARSREVLHARGVNTRRKMYAAVASSWRSVHDALVASALTTIVGLGLMWFSHFEKFQFSGPIIAISLAITLLVCLSFTPAFLSGIGQLAFWPQRPDRSTDLRQMTSAAGRSPQRDTSDGYWNWLASAIVLRPAFALAVTLGVLAGPAIYGVACLGRVTYDLTEELSSNAPSRRGAELISKFFSTLDGSPITILLTRKTAFDSEESLRAACDELSALLYLDGVDSVRSLTDPLGDYPPGKRMGLFDKDAWRRRILQNHRITKDRYVSSLNNMSRRVAKFDVILSDNPFSLESGATLARLCAKLDETITSENSTWKDTEFTTSGTTVGIVDLREVTQSDQRRIQVLVTIGVWLVLVIMLRQWVLSTYLIFTVLLSYFATLGITYWTFSHLYADYSGLDWKVPLFLFVILVAVGQDYNVYLVTRIFEEQRTLGRREGVRRALAVTGGIITSCGLVMAGTFIAMTSPAVSQWLSQFEIFAWLSNGAPVLRGITELGFALAFGVLLDTLVVRSILVPAFALLWQTTDARQRT
ncbi:MAG: MMPL family transporter [Pirellulaceae bacterium]